MATYNFDVLASRENITKGVEFIEEAITKCGVKSKKKVKTLLLSEECLAEIINNVPEGETISIKVKKTLFRTTVTIVVKSDHEITIDGIDADIDLTSYDSMPNAEATIRSMILRANSEILCQSYRNNTNKMVIISGESSQKNLFTMLISMGLAIVVCLFMRLFLQESLYLKIDQYVFVTIKTLFMNALKMIIGPMVFFSIASCVSSLTDLSEIGKIGGKVMLFYTITSVLAVGAALIAFGIVRPGEFNGLSYMVSNASSNAATQTESINLLNTFINIVPDNIFTAFTNSDTLQIIFLAILLGGIATKLGGKSQAIANFFSAGDEFFQGVAAAITKCMPIAVFGFIGSMVLSMDVKVLLEIVSVLLTALLGMGIIMLGYMTIVLVYSKTNPIWFIKQALPAMFNAFALSSSNASMAFTMKTCDKNLGIDQKLYSFSIPLGATINMDGGIIVMATSFLFLAKSFGVTLSVGDLIILLVTVVLLSFGCPGICGASVVCMSVLFIQFGVPMEALSIYMGIITLIDPVDTANNIAGDLAGTYCIAKRNNMLKQPR